MTQISLLQGCHIKMLFIPGIQHSSGRYYTTHTSHHLAFYRFTQHRPKINTHIYNEASKPSPRRTTSRCSRRVCLSCLHLMSLTWCDEMAGNPLPQHTHTHISFTPRYTLSPPLPLRRTKAIPWRPSVLLELCHFSFQRCHLFFFLLCKWVHGYHEFRLWEVLHFLPSSFLFLINPEWEERDFIFTLWPSLVLPVTVSFLFLIPFAIHTTAGHRLPFQG